MVRKLFIFCWISILLLSIEAQAVFPKDIEGKKALGNHLEKMWKKLHQKELEENNLLLSPACSLEHCSDFISDAVVYTSTFDPFLSLMYKRFLCGVSISSVNSFIIENSEFQASSEKTIVPGLPFDNKEFISEIPILRKDCTSDIVTERPCSSYENVISSSRSGSSSVTIEEKVDQQLSIAIKMLLTLSSYLRVMIYRNESLWLTFCNDDMSRYEHGFFNKLRACVGTIISSDNGSQDYVRYMHLMTTFVISGLVNTDDAKNLPFMLNHQDMNSIFECLEEYILNNDKRTSWGWGIASSKNLIYDILTASDNDWASFHLKPKTCKDYLSTLLKNSKTESGDVNEGKIPSNLISALDTHSISMGEDPSYFASLLKNYVLDYKMLKSGCCIPLKKGLDVYERASRPITMSCLSIENVSCDGATATKVDRVGDAIEQHMKKLVGKCGFSKGGSYNPNSTDTLHKFMKFISSRDADASQNGIINRNNTRDKVVRIIACIKNHDAKNEKKFSERLEDASFTKELKVAISNIIDWSSFLKKNVNVDSSGSSDSFKEISDEDKISSVFQRGVFGESSPSHYVCLQNNVESKVVSARIVDTKYRVDVINIISKYMPFIMKDTTSSECLEEVDTLNANDVDTISLIYSLNAALSFAGLNIVPKPPSTFVKDDKSISSHKSFFITTFSKYVADYLEVFYKDIKDICKNNSFYGAAGKDANLEINMGVEHLLMNGWLSMNAPSNADILDSWWKYELEIDNIPCQPLYKYLAFCSHITKLSTLEISDNLFVPSKYFDSVKSGIQMCFVCALAATVFVPRNISEEGIKNLASSWPLYVALTNKLMSTVNGSLYGKVDIGLIPSLNPDLLDKEKESTWLNYMDIKGQPCKAKNQVYLLMLSSIYWGKKLQPVLNMMDLLGAKFLLPCKD